MHFANGILGSALLTLASAASSQNLTAFLSSNSQLSDLYQLIKSQPSVMDSLANATNITLFAPNNNAISQLRSSGLIGVANQAQIAALLDYHVAKSVIYAQNITSTPSFAPTMLNNSMYSNVTGGQVVEAELVNNKTVSLISGYKAVSNVTQANMNFTGGVAHIIDSVLTIPASASRTALAANLTAFVGALDKANLTNTIDYASDITIFAPQNSAFQAIGNLLSNISAKELATILQYHVLNGTVAYSTDLGNGTVKAMNGDKLKVTVESNGAVFVNAARVVNTNALIGGGVMHIIDSVLNPNDTSAKPSPSATTAAVQFSSATSASNLGSLTSGLTVTTTATNLVVVTSDVNAGQSTHSLQTGVNGGSSSSSGMGAIATGGMGAAALFGGAALVANW